MEYCRNFKKSKSVTTNLNYVTDSTGRKIYEKDCTKRYPPKRPNSKGRKNNKPNAKKPNFKKPKIKMSNSERPNLKRPNAINSNLIMSECPNFFYFFFNFGQRPD